MANGISLTGNRKDNILTGGVGDDVLKGRGGNDILSGLAGNDQLDGGTGNDELYGDEGDDRLSGGSGDDYLSGGDGSDIIDGGSGYDRVVFPVSVPITRSRCWKMAHTKSSALMAASIWCRGSNILSSLMRDNITPPSSTRFIKT